MGTDFQTRRFALLVQTSAPPDIAQALVLAKFSVVRMEAVLGSTALVLIYLIPPSRRK
jgi:hypothetical protein